MESSLRKKLKKGQFVITVEMEPPKSASPWGVYEKIRPLQGLIDGINIADSPMAKMRMSPIALAHLVQKELNIETIFHLTCRDRNILGLQSELLGAYALEVKNILTLTGDQPTNGDHPHVQGVFELDSIGLAKIADSLNKGRDYMGNELEEPTDFYIGAVANPTATDLDKEIEKIQRKISAGVNFFQTQPIFDLKQLDKFLNKLGKINVPIIYGLMPLKSLKLANYLNKNVPGIDVPNHLLDKLQLKGRSAGLEIASYLFKELRERVEGVHIFPMGDVDLVETMLKGQKQYEESLCPEAK